MPSHVSTRRPVHRALFAAMAALMALAGAITVPAIPAHAQTGCLVVESSVTVWHTGPDHGGFLLQLRLTNVCDVPVADWDLALGLAPRHTATQGWNAGWSLTTDPVVATRPRWQPAIAPGASVTIGLLGHWRGGYADPVSCTVNGFPCDGGTSNQPPEVVMTSPADGALVAVPGTVLLAADASDSDGAVERVEFYLDGDLVGSDQSAPFVVEVPLDFNFCSCTTFARAFDDGDPALSTDSEPVSFSVVSIPPAPYVVEPAALQVADGGSATVTVRLTVPTTVPFEIVVEGDPGVTAAPTSFVLDEGNWQSGQEVTVTAASGIAPASALVWVTTVPNSTAVPVEVR